MRNTTRCCCKHTWQRRSSACQSTHLHPRLLATSRSPTTKFSWVSEKDLKDFCVIRTSHWTRLPELVLPGFCSAQHPGEPSDKQACFVCSAQDFFLKTPPCFYLCSTQTSLLAVCFPSRNSTEWVSSSLEFTSSCCLDGMGLGLHLSSHSAFPRSMMYSVKATILWTTKVLFPQGKRRIFLCDQFPLKCKQKIIFKEKLGLWNYFS